MTAGLLKLEVVYALPERQTLLSVQVPEGASVEEALSASGIFLQHPELRDINIPVGIFGRVVGRDHRPADGDRIELYRPLLADPKTSRNARVAKKRSARDSARNMRS